MWDIKENIRERTVLVGLEVPFLKIPVEESLSELHQLARTAGAQVIGMMTQRRKVPHHAHYIGKGKVQELKQYVIANKINMVIIDDEIAPNQEKNLEEELNCKVIDRTRLILDIFALHATSRVGKLQVELAQMEYWMPRLKNIWHEFSRLGAGIGTRGPGERKIDTDRSKYNDMIVHIKRKLEVVKGHRRSQRRQRDVSFKKNICLIGYTNSGKSTLMNKLTDANVGVADKLFATLSPTTRQFACGKHEVLLSDTVGFIRKLPHQVVEAFMATLEQVQEADLLLHVIDMSSENYTHQMEAVMNVLGELKALDRPILKVYNKIDKLSSPPDVTSSTADTVYVSAIENKGIQELKDAIERELDKDINQVTFRVTQSRQDIINTIYKSTHIEKCEYYENDVVLECYAGKSVISAYKRYIVK